MNIFGVRIDNYSQKEILAKVEFFLDDDNFHQVATINPEFLLEARQDEKFKNILNNCDLNVADGIGIRYAFWRFRRNLRTRIAGVDLMQEILQMADEKKGSVFLAVNENGLSDFEEIKGVLEKKYPAINFQGVMINPENFADYEMLKTKYDILLCNFGAPNQEFFINKVKSGNIRLAMGIGGAFDFLTGKKKRAPKFLRFLGLEWSWRLMLEPRYRIKRIVKAVVIFPILVLFSKK